MKPNPQANSAAWIGQSLTLRRMSGSHDRHGHVHGKLDRSALHHEEGFRAIKISVIGLGLTSVIQFAIVAVGGSVALFADAFHNLGDVFTTVGLWIAFNASKRAADRRYTFGYERFEDLTGVVVVLIIAASAVVAGWESYRGLFDEREVRAIGASLAAAAIGVIGNEAVAQYKIQIGRKIRSVALEADGFHSRVDGFVSAGAVAGLIGVALGYPRADPIAGVAITGAIVWVMVKSGRDVLERLVDAVDPRVINEVDACARSIPEVREVHAVRARWAGRSLYVQLHIAVDEDLPLHEAHHIGEEVRHAVLHEIDGVSQVIVHMDPWGEGKHPSVYHTPTAHHFPDHD